MKSRILKIVLMKLSWLFLPLWVMGFLGTIKSAVREGLYLEFIMVFIITCGLITGLNPVVQYLNHSFSEYSFDDAV